MSSRKPAPPPSVVTLVAHRVLGPSLAGLVWLLAGARVPLVVAGVPGVRAALEGVRDGLEVLADPAQRRVRAGPDGAGLERLQASDAATTLLTGLHLGPDPTPALRVPFKALARGADLVASIEADTLEEVIVRLRRWDIGLSDDELSFIGLVLILRPVVTAGSSVLRVTAAHYMRPLARDPGGHIQRSGPAVLATWNPDVDAFDDFSWGIAGELAGRAGLRPGDLEPEVERRGSFLAGLAAAGVLGREEVAAALASFRLHRSAHRGVV